MASTLYSDILVKAARSTSGEYGDFEMRDWLRDKALQVEKGEINRSALMRKKSTKSNAVTHPTIGKMLMYRYDPKHKATLPYYDTFPVIFPINLYKDGFLGINLHYLPITYRARLMDALYDTLNNDRFDATTKLKIDYDLLNSAAKTKYFKPCVKRYLYGHVKSLMIEIDPKEWDYVMMLPMANFVKANERKVWDDSINFIRGK